MTEVRFYHLTASELAQALPVLLRRTLARGKRALVLVPNPARAEAVSELLWTYEEASFLPHGTAKDGRAEEQPIWITPAEENLNGAEYLFLLEGTDSAQVADFEVCALLFDGRDEVALARARSLWRRLKEEGHTMSYWQQNEAGGWQEAAKG